MKTVINLASYRKEDWNRFKESADDKEKLHDTWDEWRKSFMNTKVSLESEGFNVREVILDIDDLIQFCRQKGLKNDGSTRSQYVSRP